MCPRVSEEAGTTQALIGIKVKLSKAFISSGEETFNSQLPDFDVPVTNDSQEKWALFFL